MKRKRFTEEQIIGNNKLAEAGTPVKDLIRTHGIAKGPYDHWNAKFDGLVGESLLDFDRLVVLIKRNE